MQFWWQEKVEDKNPAENFGETPLHCFFKKCFKNLINFGKFNFFAFLVAILQRFFIAPFWLILSGRRLTLSQKCVVSVMAGPKGNLDSFCAGFCAMEKKEKKKLWRANFSKQLSYAQLCSAMLSRQRAHCRVLVSKKANKHTFSLWVQKNTKIFV